jgi:4-amino-4-deoxy-L-arabinose transferase-like glycosyltransferase
MIMRLVQENKLLTTILFFAFLLRIWGVDYGLPYFFVGDEQPLVAGALKMAQLKTLLPVLHPDEFRFLYYPPLMSYIYLILLAPFILIKYLLGSWASFIAFQNFLILNPGFIWLIARIFNVFIGLATIYLIYLISRKIFNRSVGLLSALFLSLSFFHLQLSHFTRHWVPAVFFVYLVILFAFYIYQSPQRKYYFWAGLTAGLAFGISYITVIALVVVLMVHCLSERSWKEKIKDKNLWLTLIIFIAVASIFVVLHPQEFFRILFGEDSTLAHSKNLIGWLLSFVYYFKILIFFELAILIFALLGWLILWFKSKKIWLVFSLWPVLYITVLYLFFHHEARYLILIIPWLAFLAAYGFYSFFNKLSATIGSRTIAGAILSLVFLYPLFIAVQYDYLLSQKDTRLLAKEWIEKNIPAGSKIITDWSEIKLTASKESLLKQKEIDKSSLRTDDRVLLLLDDKQYPQPAFDVLRLHFIGDKLPVDLKQYFLERDYKYFVIQYWQGDELTKQAQDIISQAASIKRFDSGLKDVSYNINGNFEQNIFIIFLLKRLGPIVEIYQL